MSIENIVPLSVDLATPDQRMDITKGIEHISYLDVPFAADVITSGVELGQWLVLTSSNTLEYPTTSAVANTYPVWVGNDQLDAVATGAGTVIVTGGFIYRTTHFTSGSYTVGENLTVKNALGNLDAASGSDPVLARVWAPVDSTGALTVIVLNR